MIHHGFVVGVLAMRRAAAVFESTVYSFEKEPEGEQNRHKGKQISLAVIPFQKQTMQERDPRKTCLPEALVQNCASLGDSLLFGTPLWGSSKTCMEYIHLQTKLCSLRVDSVNSHLTGK